MFILADGELVRLLKKAIAEIESGQRGTEDPIDDSTTVVVGLNATDNICT